MNAIFLHAEILLQQLTVALMHNEFKCLYFLNFMAFSVSSTALALSCINTISGATNEY